jgi:hypothetical protein
MSCSCGRYLVGDKPRFSATFRIAVTAVAYDPSSVTAIVRRPNGLETEYVYGVGADVQHDDVGVYSLAVEFDEPGDWTVRFKSGGNLVSAHETHVNVRPSAFASP